jgi:hypothetical protein
MKKPLKISFLLAALCFTIPVYADGDMPTGSKTCTQNCGGLYDGTKIITTTSDDKEPEESPIGEIYAWVYQQISELVG